MKYLLIALLTLILTPLSGFPYDEDTDERQQEYPWERDRRIQQEQEREMRRIGELDQIVQELRERNRIEEERNEMLERKLMGSGPHYPDYQYPTVPDYLR